MPDFHVIFRDLLHAVNLLRRTNGFTSLPKEDVLRIFSLWKIGWVRPSLNPRTWVPKANTLRLDHRSRQAYSYIVCGKIRHFSFLFSWRVQMQYWRRIMFSWMWRRIIWQIATSFFLEKPSAPLFSFILLSSKFLFSYQTIMRQISDVSNFCCHPSESHKYGVSNNFWGTWL